MTGCSIDRLLYSVSITVCSYYMLSVKQETVSMYLRDGVRLDADIYCPQSSEKFPVLLMRQPYGRKIASTVVYAHPQWYASQGYIVVIQDVRGRGTSQGEFELFINEINDGFDTLTWASEIPGSTGKVGMYGFSYQGMTQLYAAATKHRALKVICPSMIAYDLYHDWAYENGAFCWQLNLLWAIQMSAETVRLRGDKIAFHKLYNASRNPPLYDPIPANPEILKEFAPESFYHIWLDHHQPDEYWEKLSPKTLLQGVDLPMLHIGGWFDPYLRGTLNLYQESAANSRFPQHLIIGPWGHLPWNRAVGCQNYGGEAASPIDRLQVDWFNYFLKDKDTEIFTKPPVCLFEMGSNCWRYFDDFSLEKSQNYFLKSSGLASINEEDGRLEAEPSLTSLPSEDFIVHDPWRPVPALGGHAAIPAGSFERSSIDCRTDVLTYTSAPLTEDLSLTGVIKAEIYCQADTASFDICAVLSEVHPDSKVYNFTQGYMRVNCKTLPVVFSLQATCIKIRQGNCLRLSLSAASFPAYPVNPGTGQLPEQTKLIEAQVITLKVLSGGNFPSKITIGLS